ncbi:MAG: glycosyltransferase [Candidatus Micrarchaeota archaeon]
MISVIIPIHNEAGTLPRIAAEVERKLRDMGAEYELILCEDGSTDGSAEAARKLQSGSVRVIISQTRLGRGRSLSDAITAAKGDIVVYMDADLATDLFYLSKIISPIKAGADIATGSRLMVGSKVTGRGFIRDISSKGYNLMLRLLFKTSIKDHQCGFKAFRRSSVLPLLKEVQNPHWFWDSELLIRAQAKGLKVAEVPIVWGGRAQSRVNLISDIPEMGFAAIRLRLSMWQAKTF